MNYLLTPFRPNNLNLFRIVDFGQLLIGFEKANTVVRCFQSNASKAIARFKWYFFAQLLSATNQNTAN